MGNTEKKIFFLLFILFPFISYAQNAEIRLGKHEITIKEVFTISLRFPKERKRDFHNFPYYGFPEIEDFWKDRTEYTQDKDKNFTITQYYLPTKPGEFHLNSFAFSIGGKIISSKGATVRVILGNKNKTDSSSALIKKTSKDYKETEMNSYLKLSVSKQAVYNGEGFVASLYLYTALSNKTEMTFINLDDQFAGLVKKIKPVNCWAEELDNAGTITDTINIANEKFKRWTIYRVMLYPLDTLAINFPLLNFDLIKYAVAEDPSQTAVFRKPQLYTFANPPITVTVHPLPPHPLRDNMPVGEFRLREKIEHTRLQTGKSCNYEFDILGEGNITAIPAPQLKENPNLEFYTPEVKQVIYKKKYPVGGMKSFDYYILPQEPGSYKLRDFIYFIYFNPTLKKYDTLFPKTELLVEGESQKNTFISSNSTDPFYRNIDKASNELRDYEKDQSIKYFANIIILFMLVTTVFLMLRK